MSGVYSNQTKSLSSEHLSAAYACMCAQFCYFNHICGQKISTLSCPHVSSKLSVSAQGSSSMSIRRACGLSNTCNISITYQKNACELHQLHIFHIEASISTTTVLSLSTSRPLRQEDLRAIFTLKLHLNICNPIQYLTPNILFMELVQRDSWPWSKKSCSFNSGPT